MENSFIFIDSVKNKQAVLPGGGKKTLILQYFSSMILLTWCESPASSVQAMPGSPEQSRAGQEHPAVKTEFQSLLICILNSNLSISVSLLLLPTPLIQ